MSTSSERWLGTVVSEISLAVRRLRRDSGVVVAAMACLSLGIAACVIVFSFLDGILLRPLPFAQSGQLVAVSISAPSVSEPEDLPVPLYVLLRDATTSFDAVGAYDRLWSVNLGPEPVAGMIAERINGHRASATLLEALGVSPLLGRWYTRQEDTFGASPTVLLGYDLWRRRFGARADIVGTTVELDGIATAVVGVMPPGFALFDGFSDFFLPFRFSNQLLRGPVHWLVVVGRVQHAASVASVQTQMAQVFAEYWREFPERDNGWHMRVRPLREALFGWLRTPLMLIQGAAFGLLLIACANLASLLLTRSATRRHDTALRLALGQSRGALARQLLIESSLLAVSAAVVGIVLAALALPVLVALAPATFPRLDRVALNVRVLAFTVTLSTITAFVVGLAPAIRASRTDIVGILHSSSGRQSQGRAVRRRLGALVIAQTAIAFTLMICAGLVLRSSLKLLSADMGFKQQELIVAELRLPLALYTREAGTANGYPVRDFSPEIPGLFQRALTRLRELPGISAAAGLDDPPLTRANNAPFRIEGRDVPPAENSHYFIDYHWVTSNLFRTMQVPVLRGRDFTDADTVDSLWVAIINEEMAKRFWSGRDPIGAHISLGWADERPREIVGIVRATRRTSRDLEFRPTLYLPLPQQLARHHAGLALERTHITFVMRSRSPAAQMVRPIREALSQEIPAYPVYNIRDLADVAGDQRREPRFYLIILSAVAFVALVIASIGVYSVLSHTAAQQRKELGIRGALGAGRAELFRLIFGRGIALAAAGQIAGLVCALVAARSLSALLWGVAPTDAFTLLLTSGTFTMVAVLACMAPALRASRTDPIISLKHD